MAPQYNLGEQISEKKCYMDSFFDSLKRKMSKRYNKGEQPHPAPRPVYNTRKAEREWRERQVDLSREALEHREAVLNELRGETSRNSYGCKTKDG